jgi:hypothetical protein
MVKLTHVASVQLAGAGVYVSVVPDETLILSALQPEALGVYTLDTGPLSDAG